MKKVVLIGAGGHSRSVIALLQKNHINIERIYDQNFKNDETIFNIPVGSIKNIQSSENIILAIGDNKSRANLFLDFQNQIITENIFHPSASIETQVNFGKSNLVFAKAYLNNGAQIGHNNIINTAAVLEHEVEIGSHCHIAVGAFLLGRCQIGNQCFIGAGSIIRDGVHLCDSVTVGANSYVAKDITEPGVYVGSPARRIN